MPRDSVTSRTGQRGQRGQRDPWGPCYRQGGGQAPPQGLLQELQLGWALQDQHGSVTMGQAVTRRIRGELVASGAMSKSVTDEHSSPGGHRAGPVPSVQQDGPCPLPPKAGGTRWPVTAGGNHCHRVPHSLQTSLPRLPEPTDSGLLQGECWRNWGLWGKGWGQGQVPCLVVLSPCY